MISLGLLNYNPQHPSSLPLLLWFVANSESAFPGIIAWLLILKCLNELLIANGAHSSEGLKCDSISDYMFTGDSKHIGSCLTVTHIIGSNSVLVPLITSSCPKFLI
uniref:Uncharacterized protein n=2 Tax=Micrurus TaxID=8634 RepID=A0A2D4FM84_MICCO